MSAGLWRFSPLLPYLVCAAAWSINIAQAPEDFFRKLSGNISGLDGCIAETSRGGGLKDPITAIRREVMDR